MIDSREILHSILTDDQVAKKACWRTGMDRYTLALWDAVEVLPDGPERRALAYLARTPGTFIILDQGDKVVTNGLKMAIERL